MMWLYKFLDILLIFELDAMQVMLLRCLASFFLLYALLLHGIVDQNFFFSFE